MLSMQRRLPFPASRAPEGQGRLDAILHVELAVPYFPFRQTTPTSSTDLTTFQLRRLAYWRIAFTCKGSVC
jgi:hypothetical protein